MSSSIKIVKRKATGFFDKENFEIIQQAIKDVSNIMTHASILLRAFYIDQFEMGKEIIIDSQVVSFACNIVQGAKKPPLRTNGEERKLKECQKNKNIDKDEMEILEKKLKEEDKKKENIKQVFTDMLRVFKDLYNNREKVAETNLSISYILIYSI